MAKKGLSAAQFAKKHKISSAKVSQMLPYIKGAFRCCDCGAWNIPENAIAVYLPDRRLYKSAEEYRQYCYILDAVNLGMHVEPRILNLTENEVHSIVKRLKSKKIIVLIAGRQTGSLNTEDHKLCQIAWQWRVLVSDQRVRFIKSLLND